MSVPGSFLTRAAAGVVAGLAAGVLGACGGDAAGKLESAELLRASVTSRQATAVTVTFVESSDPACGRYEGADVQDDVATATVTVLVTLRTSGTTRDCPGDGVETERMVRLTHPLGDRRLVDRATGQAVEVAVAP